jgi:nucleotide-binding universal stress UspA family protein
VQQDSLIIRVPANRKERRVAAFEKLLVPMDCSEEGARALAPALGLARRMNASVTLFGWATDDAGESAAKRYLQDIAAEHHASGVAIDVRTAVGGHGPAPSIAEAAVPETVICMATHARSVLGHAFLGSVAEAVMRCTAGPILLVGPGAGDRIMLSSGSVVAAVDGSSFSENAIPVAAEWARATGLPLRLIRAVEAGGTYPGSAGAPDAAGDGYLAVLAERAGTDPPPAFDVLYGDPFDAVSAFSSTHALLLVLAIRDRTAIGRAVLGSAAMQIVHRTTAPVLVVRTET